MTRAEQAARKVYPYEGGTKGAICEASIPIYIQGYEQAEKDLGWHSVEESLPPVAEEVIVLTDDDGFTHPCPMKICFAHLVCSDVTITVGGKPYKPQAYSGWNIPGVKFWMPMPEIPKEEK